MTPTITTGVHNRKPSPRNGHGYRVGNMDHKFWEVCGVKFSRKHHAVRFANEFYPQWDGTGDAEMMYLDWLQRKARDARNAGDHDTYRKVAQQLESLETY